MADEGKQAGGNRWGDPISEDRQAELKGLADQQRELAGKPLAERIARTHFRGVFLNGGDVFWLAAYAQATREAQLHQRLSGPTDWKDFFAEAQRLLRNARGASDIDDSTLFLNLSALHLEGADFDRAKLEGVHLSQAHLCR